MIDLREYNYRQLCEFIETATGRSNIDYTSYAPNNKMCEIYVTARVDKFEVISLLGSVETVDSLTFEFNTIGNVIQFNVYIGSSCFNMYDIPACIDRVLRYRIRCKS